MPEMKGERGNSGQPPNNPRLVITLIVALFIVITVGLGRYFLIAMNYQSPLIEIYVEGVKKYSLLIVLLLAAIFSFVKTVSERNGLVSKETIKLAGAYMFYGSMIFIVSIFIFFILFPV